MSPSAKRLIKRTLHAILRRSGNIYTPWPDPHEARVALDRAELASGLPGVNIDDEEMSRLWGELAPLAVTAPFTEKHSAPLRFYYENGYFSYADAQIYFAMIGRFRPRRIIEIGSGFTSALALDAREYFGLETRLTFIEPDMTRLRGLFRDGDYESVELHEMKVQDTDSKLFGSLEADDILFIDSSHVLKTGSDLCFELFEVLPTLRTGVLVHFHDISSSFEYPREWIMEERRGWNEAYALRAFLMYNTAFKVCFFNNYFVKRFSDQLHTPGIHLLRNPGGSLWLRRA
jgi:hypothetical protein